MNETERFLRGNLKPITWGNYKERSRINFEPNPDGAEGKTLLDRSQYEVITAANGYRAVLTEGREGEEIERGCPTKQAAREACWNHYVKRVAGLFNPLTRNERTIQSMLMGGD